MKGKLKVAAFYPKFCNREISRLLISGAKWPRGSCSGSHVGDSFSRKERNGLSVILTIICKLQSDDYFGDFLNFGRFWRIFQFGQ